LRRKSFRSRIETMMQEPKFFAQLSESSSQTPLGMICGPAMAREHFQQQALDSTWSISDLSNQVLIPDVVNIGKTLPNKQFLGRKSNSWNTSLPKIPVLLQANEDYKTKEGVYPDPMKFRKILDQDGIPSHLKVPDTAYNVSQTLPVKPILPSKFMRNCLDYCLTSNDKLFQTFEKSIQQLMGNVQSPLPKPSSFNDTQLKVHVDLLEKKNSRYLIAIISIMRGLICAFVTANPRLLGDYPGNFSEALGPACSQYIKKTKDESNGSQCLEDSEKNIVNTKSWCEDEALLRKQLTCLKWSDIEAFRGLLKLIPQNKETKELLLQESASGTLSEEIWLKPLSNICFKYAINDLFQNPLDQLVQKAEGCRKVIAYLYQKGLTIIRKNTSEIHLVTRIVLGEMASVVLFSNCVEDLQQKYISKAQVRAQEELKTMLIPLSE